MAFLELTDVAKSFGEHVVLDGITLSVDDGETLALLGPSGSGKTTLLRTIAGFESADGGALRVGGEDVTRFAPSRRNFGMVFQHYALFPHLSVAENVAFGLEGRVNDAGERDGRVREMLVLVDLAGFESRRIHQISGGQQQRVALARALAPRPRLLLLDEPLSNLDRTLREKTRREIRDTLERVGITAVWVTHEQEEAFDVGDRVAVLHQGRLEQLATPEDLYLRPASSFVAGFVGRASRLAGVWLGEGRARPSGLDDGAWPADTASVLEAQEPIELVSRPEALELTPDAEGSVAGEVVARRFAGSQTFYTLETPGGERVEVLGEVDEAAVGDAVGFRPRAGAPAPRAFPR